MEKTSKVILVIIAAVILAGCGTTAVTKVTLKDRPDSLVVKGDSIAFIAHSDSLAVDSAQAVIVDETIPAINETDTTGSESKAVQDETPRKPVTVFRSIKAQKDTTIGRFKFRFGYRYPGDVWSFQLLAGDTTARWTIHDSLIEKPYPVEVIPFWVKMVLALAGITVLGMIFALIKK